MNEYEYDVKEMEKQLKGNRNHEIASMNELHTRFVARGRVEHSEK